MDVQGRVAKDGRKFPGRLEITLDAVAARGMNPSHDHDTIVLECFPRSTPCPDGAPSTTTTTLPGLSVNPTVIVGAGGGTLYGLNENKKNDDRYRAAYSSCMRARGFTS